MAGSGTTILMYHSVGGAPDEYTVTPEAFARHLRAIRDHYRVIRLKDIHTFLGFDNARTVAITFDDAFADFAEHALPALRQYSMPATVFAPTGYLGQSNMWDRHHDRISLKRIMTRDELVRLSRDELVDVGSHTVDHPCMSGLSPNEMHRQATASRRVLEEWLGLPVTMFSYPYGQRRDFSRATERAVRAAGYTLAVTTCWGTRHTPRDIFRLRRISLSTGDNDAAVRAKIDGHYDWIGVKERIGFAVRSGLRLTAHTHAL